MDFSGIFFFTQSFKDLANLGAKASLYFVLVFSIPGCGESYRWTIPDPPGPKPIVELKPLDVVTLQVEAVNELGPLKTNLKNITARDVGASGKIGSRVLWTFGDTLFTGTFDGIPRSATAAWSNGGAFTNSVTDAVQADGSPYQFIPYSAEEFLFNAQNKKDNKRVALWPNRPLELQFLWESGEAVIYFDKYIVGPGLFDYENKGVGVVFVREGQIVSERPDEKMLFGPDEPHMVGSLYHEGMIYVYGKPKGKDGLIVGRVLAAKSYVGDRSQYGFWNGKDWVSNISEAQDIGPGLLLPGASSWNEYLQRFVILTLDVWDNNKFKVYLSEKPQGPFKKELEFSNPGAAGVGLWNYAQNEQPAYQSEGGRKIIVTYYHPESTFVGSIQSLEITLKAALRVRDVSKP